jgi:hypothetical protein
MPRLLKRATVLAAAFLTLCSGAEVAAAASPLPSAPEVTLFGDELSLYFTGFWLSSELHDTWINETGQAGGTALDLARLTPSGIHTHYVGVEYTDASGTVQHFQWDLDTKPNAYPGASRPAVAVVLDGSADLLAGVATSTIEHNLTAIYRYMQAHGAAVVPITPLPGSTGAPDPSLNGEFGYVAYTPAQEAARLELRRWVLGQRAPLVPADAEPVAGCGLPTVYPDFCEQRMLATITARAVGRAQKAGVRKAQKHQQHRSPVRGGLDLPGAHARASHHVRAAAR